MTTFTRTRSTLRSQSIEHIWQWRSVHSTSVTTAAGGWQVIPQYQRQPISNQSPSIYHAGRRRLYNFQGHVIHL